MKRPQTKLVSKEHCLQVGKLYRITGPALAVAFSLMSGAHATLKPGDIMMFLGSKAIDRDDKVYGEQVYHMQVWFHQFLSPDGVILGRWTSTPKAPSMYYWCEEVVKGRP